MDTAILWRVALIQAIAVLVLSLALGAVFPSDFFEAWGWLSGRLGAIFAIGLFASLCAYMPRPTATERTGG